MNCCERTLVTLACLAGMIDRDADTDSGHMVLQAHVDTGLCDACSKSMASVQGSMLHGTLVRTILERVAQEYVMTIGRCDGVNDIQKRQINNVVVDCINHHLGELGPQ